VGGVQVGVVADQRPRPVRGPVERVVAERRHHRVHVGEHHPPARPGHPTQLHDGGGRVGQVGERQRAHGQVHRPVDERQPLQLAQRQPGQGLGGDLAGRHRQHRRAPVDAEDPVAAARQPGGMTAGAARGVERPPGWQPLQQSPHRRLLGLDDHVGRGVVVGRDGSVALPDRDLVEGDHGAVGGHRRAGRQPGGIGGPRRHHGGVRAPVPQDGEPLDADQELAQVVLGR
jgi:hypothetical protein